MSARRQYISAQELVRTNPKKYDEDLLLSDEKRLFSSEPIVLLPLPQEPRKMTLAEKRAYERGFDSIK